MTELNLIGTILGRFEIIKELGRGGMAVVYQARQTDLDRIIALKVLPPSLTHDASYVARFRQEARNAAHLEHPHIMPIYEIGEANGLHYIAMKYITGQTLKDLVQAEGSFSVQRAATILAQVGDALDHAHKQGIIHRDIKPSNMMVTEEGWVYLTDFGLARGTGGTTAGLTMAGTVMGTPEYMSPEQAQGLPNVGPPTDIYALGVVLYELLTGTFPFKADTPMGMLAARLLQAPTPPRDIRGDLSSPVEDVVMRALARKPESRFASAAAMVAALRVAAGIGSAEPPRPATPMAGMPAIGATILTPSPPDRAVAPTPGSSPLYVRQAAPPHVVAPASALPPFPTAQTVQPNALPRKGPNNLTVIFGAIGVLVLACIGLLVVFARSGPGPTTPPTAVVNADVQALLTKADQALQSETGLATAISDYRKALELAPDDPQVLAKLALSTNASGDWATAEGYANQLIDAPTSSNRQVALGYALLADNLASQGDMTTALTQIPQALTNDETLALGHAIQSNLLAKRAVVISSTAEMETALASLDRATDRVGDEAPLVQALTHHALGYTFAQQYQMSGNEDFFRQSEEQYQQALKLLPSAGLFQANLTYLQSLKKDYAKAREGFTQALNTGYTLAQADIGWMYYDEADAKAQADPNADTTQLKADAEHAFDEALTLNPNAPDGYFGKARLRYDEQDYDGAIKLLNEALTHNPRSPELQSWLGEAYFWKGIYSTALTDLNVKKDALAQSAAAYLKAIEFNDRSIFAISGLAWTLQHQEKYAESVQRFDQAIALSPQNAVNYNGKGWSLYNQGKYQDAEAAFRASLERDDRAAETHYNLAQTLEKLGGANEAKKEYQRVLALDANHSGAQAALDRLGP